MLNGASDYKCWIPLMKVLIYMEEGLGPSPAVYLPGILWRWMEKTWAYLWSIFTWDAVGVEGKQPFWLRPSCRSYHHGGGNMRSITRGIWLVDVIGYCINEPSISLWSPACLYVCNYEIKFWACTKQAHQKKKIGKGVMITKLSFFCEHYSVLLLYSIPHFYLLLFCSL